MRGTATDRVTISIVSTATHQDHKTSACGFDGCKTHVAVDPASEIVTAATVTPGNSGDPETAETLLADTPAAGPRPPRRSQ